MHIRTGNSHLPAPPTPTSYQPTISRPSQQHVYGISNRSVPIFLSLDQLQLRDYDYPPQPQDLFDSQLSPNSSWRLIPMEVCPIRDVALVSMRACDCGRCHLCARHILTMSFLHEAPPYGPPPTFAAYPGVPMAPGMVPPPGLGKLSAPKQLPPFHIHGHAI